MLKTFLYNKPGAEQDIVSSYLSKVTVSSIALKHSVTPRTIHNILKKHGVTRGVSRRKDIKSI